MILANPENRIKYKCGEKHKNIFMGKFIYL